jgi:hypothetical protein
MDKATILFIPVSTGCGIGEYMRSIIIAKAIKKQWPESDIHFILNSNVPYLNACPFTVHLSKGSATKDVVGVNNIIQQLKPNLTIFDASGRAKQFECAKKVGSKIIFISQHKRKRNRGLKFNRLFAIDEHWVVQPDFAIEPLSLYQQLKLKYFNKTPPKNIGPVFSLNSLQQQDAFFASLDVKRDGFYLFNAGSGGHKKGNVLCADIYYKAAKKFALQTNIPCIMLFGSNYPRDLPTDSQVICLKTLENGDFISLLDGAKGRVVSAGDSLLQCIELKKPSIAASVSNDQPKRLKSCVEHGLVIASSLDADALVEQALNLLDQNTYQNIMNSINQVKPVIALDIVMEDIKALLTL